MADSILIVTPFYYEPPRQKVGVTQLAVSLSRYVRVVVISSLVEGAKAFEQQGNLTIYRFRPWLYLRSIPYVVDPLLWHKIIHVARKEKSDIMVAITLEFLSTFLAALAKGVLHIPLVVWPKGDRPTFGKSLLDLVPQVYHQTLGRFAIRRADRVFCQTEHLRETVRRLGASDREIRIVPQGVDTERFRPGLDTTALRRELGIREGVRVVLFVGRLFPVKGVRYLLQAGKAILEQYPQTLFVITGIGPLEQELKAMAQQIDSTRFLFVGFRQDIPLLLNLATVFVLPSLTEGMPQTIVEAYACGVSVVASNVGGVRDILRDGDHGFAVPARDPAAIAHAVNRILGDEALRRKMSANNRQTAVTFYDLDKVARETLRELQMLSGEKREASFHSA